MTTENQKRAMAKYLASSKGKAARKRAQDRYNNSLRGRAARAKYLRSWNGKDAVAKSRRLRAMMN